MAAVVVMVQLLDRREWRSADIRGHLICYQCTPPFDDYNSSNLTCDEVRSSKMIPNNIQLRHRLVIIMVTERLRAP
jgi:hypothetical protein